MALNVTMFVAVGLLYIGLGIPLWRRRVGRNHWYGLRCPDSLSSDQVWYESNAVCGRLFVRLGAAVMVLAAGLAALPWRTSDEYALAMSGALTLGTVLLALRGLAVARDIRKRVE